MTKISKDHLAVGKKNWNKVLLTRTSHKMVIGIEGHMQDRISSKPIE